MGPQRKAQFEFVLAGDVVSRKKPDPEIYEMAKSELGLPAADCLVIEDSRNGMLAALGADLACLITTSTYTREEDFSGAALVIAELGDPPATHLRLEELAALIE
jgi:beta-phosphoglucomutase-like phosphatase (HAD superfamily)